MSATMLDAALAYAAAGKPVFPVRRSDKSPLVKRGFHAASRDVEEIRRWWARWPKAMIGMPTGAISGVDVVDIDVKYNGFASVPDWQTLSPMIVRTPSGGAHLYFRAVGVGCTTSAIGPGVDTRGEGGYVVVPPSANDVGSYTVEAGAGLRTAQLPPFPDALRARLGERSRRQTEASSTTGPVPPEAPVELVAAAIQAIPNSDLGWDDWNLIGMAVWRATGATEDGFRCFDDFSRKSGKYDADATRARWDHYSGSPPDRVGAGTLFRRAHEADPRWLVAFDRQLQADIKAGCAASAEYERLWAEGLSIEDVTTEVAPLAAIRKQAAPPDTDFMGGWAKSSAVTVEPIQTFWHGDVPATAPRWAIRDRLPETGAGLLIGQWGSYKTFVALDLAAHLMLGWPWAGQPVYRRGGVLMLALEGAGGLPMRLAALVENMIEPRKADVPEGLNPQRLPFVWVEVCPPLLVEGEADPVGTIVATAKAVEARFEAEYGLPLALILIDTMAVAARFQNENDNSEVTLLMAQLHDLSRKTGAVVLGVDHLGKNAAAGARGASAKEANVDFVIALEADPVLDPDSRKPTGEVENHRLLLRKLREGPAGMEIAFGPRVVDMGVDDHGYPVTSVVIDWDVVRAPKPEARKQPQDRTLSDAFEEALRLDGQDVERPVDGKVNAVRAVRAVSRDNLRSRYRAKYKPGQDVHNSAKDERFRKAIAGAIVQGEIGKVEVAGKEFFFRVEVPY